MNSLAQGARAVLGAGAGVTGGRNRSSRAALRCSDNDERHHE